MSEVVRIGSRGSQLALWQANEVARRLRDRGFNPEIVTVRTSGDKQQDVKPSSIGGKGVFIKELEESLASGAIDIAVHSLKDVPSIVPERFALAAFLERADPRDAWIHPERRPIDRMPPLSKIGTSAPRRRAQLRALYPRFRLQDIRGNVDTRINKMRAGLYDGIILASAGMTRLGRQREITSYFSVDEMLPAAGQGIIAIETASPRGAQIAATINHPPTAMAAQCERGVLQKFGNLLDCDSPVAVHATIEDEIAIRALFAEPDGERSIRVTRKGSDAQAVIDATYEALVAAGAVELVS